MIKDFQQKSDLTYTHRFMADGEQSFFALPMEPWSELSEDITVKVSKDGGATWTERILELDPLDGRPETIQGVPGRAYICVFNWGVRFPTVDLPSAGDLVEVDYRYVIPERVFVYFDPDSIDEMARREGSDGHHEIMISLPDYRVSTLDPIKFYAEMILRRNAWPILTGSLETFLRGWRSGQFFYVQSAVRDIFDVAHWVKTGRGEKVPVRVWVEQVRKKIVSLAGAKAVIRTSVDFSSRPFRR